MRNIRRELTLAETGCWVEAMRKLGVGQQEALKLAGELWKEERDD